MSEEELCYFMSMPKLCIYKTTKLEKKELVYQTGHNNKQTLKLLFGAENFAFSSNN